MDIDKTCVREPLNGLRIHLLALTPRIYPVRAAIGTPRNSAA